MKVCDGCTACANVAYKLSDISFIYPITPSSPMARQMDNMRSEGKKNIFNDTVNVVEMQSEAGAAGSLHGALNAGMLASTFTASQGLLLMIPNMYKIAGECLPAVIHVAARSLSTHALSIFGDHQDIYACRQTGFCMLASTSVYDTGILSAVAHLSAIEGSLPFLHFFDGFRTSHEYNVINEIDDSILKKYINYDKIEEFRKRSLNSNKEITKGTSQNEDIYFQLLEAKNNDYNKMADIVSDYMKKINKEMNTDYKPFNYFGSKDAKYVIVAMCSVCDTIKKVVQDNDEFGLIEVHLYRPFSSKYLKDVLPESVQKIAVLDRTKEQGSIGEPLYLDVLSALKDLNIPIYGGRYGLSSKNVSPSDIYDVYMNLKNNMKDSFVLGINDDVTNLSLKHYDYHYENKYTEFKIYGYGSDGMIGSSKNLLKILSQGRFVQGYFEYDSKKSGGITVSHLRCDRERIDAPYYVEHPSLIVVTKDEYFHKIEMINDLEDCGTLLISTKRNAKELNSFLPDNVKNILRKKHAKVYTINAESIAEENGIKGKIGMVIESNILKILKIQNYENKLIEDVQDRFKRKGEEVVNANIRCIQNANKNLKEVIIDEEKGIILPEKKDIFEKIFSREGNSLSVGNLASYKDGTFPGGLTNNEKRKISNDVPKWDKEKCIECGMCSMVCPHAAIRPFKVDNDSKYEKLGIDTFDKKNKYVISCSEDDCTGCGLCINTCPKDALSFGQRDGNLQTISEDLFTNYKVFNPDAKTISDIQLNTPLFEFSGACAGCGETPYIKLLTQIVGKKLVIANATGCSSIYGASSPSTAYKLSWGSSLFEDNAEYGYGIYKGFKELKNRCANYLKDINKEDLGCKLLNDELTIEEEKQVENLMPNDLKDYVSSKSVWCIGGDGWAYDIGFGGIDHVLSSGENIRILVLDTEVYSNTGGQASKSSGYGQVAEFASDGKKTSKKDLFRIAMSYSNIYVATISLGANMMQAIKVFKEAENHKGPSLVIAYSPCVEQGIYGGMSNSIEEEKFAVDAGYFILMRYFDNKLYIDSKEPNFDKYKDFLNNEVRYMSLKIKTSNADKMLEENKQNAIDRYNYYKNLL